MKEEILLKLRSETVVNFEENGKTFPRKSRSCATSHTVKTLESRPKLLAKIKEEILLKLKTETVVNSEENRKTFARKNGSFTVSHTVKTSESRPTLLAKVNEEIPLKLRTTEASLPGEIKLLKNVAHPGDIPSGDDTTLSLEHVTDYTICIIQEIQYVITKALDTIKGMIIQMLRDTSKKTICAVKMNVNSKRHPENMYLTSKIPDVNVIHMESTAACQDQIETAINSANSDIFKDVKRLHNRASLFALYYLQGVKNRIKSSMKERNEYMMAAINGIFEITDSSGDNPEELKDPCSSSARSILSEIKNKLNSRTKKAFVEANDSEEESLACIENVSNYTRVAIRRALKTTFYKLENESWNVLEKFNVIVENVDIEATNYPEPYVNLEKLMASEIKRIIFTTEKGYENLVKISYECVNNIVELLYDFLDKIENITSENLITIRMIVETSQEEMDSAVNKVKSYIYK